MFLNVSVIPLAFKEHDPESIRSCSISSSSHLSLFPAADLLDVNRMLVRNQTEHIIETTQSPAQNITAYHTQTNWNLYLESNLSEKVPHRNQMDGKIDSRFSIDGESKPFENCLSLRSAVIADDFIVKSTGNTATER